MTKHPNRDTTPEPNARLGAGVGAPEIVVTEEMVDAGIRELGEHRFTDDWRLIVEDVYRVMAYVSLLASSTSEER
jgi:hypothetical protein